MSCTRPPPSTDQRQATVDSFHRPAEGAPSSPLGLEYGRRLKDTDLCAASRFPRKGTKASHKRCHSSCGQAGMCGVASSGCRPLGRDPGDHQQTAGVEQGSMFPSEASADGGCDWTVEVRNLALVFQPQCYRSLCAPSNSFVHGLRQKGIVSDGHAGQPPPPTNAASQVLAVLTPRRRTAADVACQRTKCRRSFPCLLLACSRLSRWKQGRRCLAVLI